MEEIYISLQHLDSSGRPSGPPLKDSEALKRGHYPARQPTRIRLGPLQAPGLYLLELGSSLRGGGLDTNRMMLFVGSR
jgi:hypothetical protein